jgi:hypothetical protein
MSGLFSKLSLSNGPAKLPPPELNGYDIRCPADRRSGLWRELVSFTGQGNLYDTNQGRLCPEWTAIDSCWRWQSSLKLIVHPSRVACSPRTPACNYRLLQGQRVPAGQSLGPLRAGRYFCQNVSSTLHRGRDRCILAGRLRGCRLPEKRVVSPDELLSALKRYLAESGDTEEAVASQIGVNHHTLRRWLSDRQSPKKGKLALAAAFLRHAGYL